METLELDTLDTGALAHPVKKFLPNPIYYLPAENIG